MNKNVIPLVIEQHPKSYTGLPFLTFIKYKNDDFLTIVDNSTAKMIRAYVLDLCNASDVNQERILETAQYWYDTCRDEIPVSFIFSRQKLTSDTNRVLQTFNLDYVTRIIGPVPKFQMDVVKSVRRRKKKPLPPNIVIEPVLLQKPIF